MMDIDKKRVEIWVALSDIFCDTETNYHYIAHAVEGNTIENLKSIFFEEVAPVCGPNLMTPIPPVWAGFNEQELVKSITDMLGKRERSFIARVMHTATSLFMRFYFKSHWREAEGRLNYYWTRPTPQPLQLASLAFEAALREEKVFQDIFPSLEGSFGSPFASNPDSMLAYFSRCVALGMEYQEYPERLAPLLKEARQDIVVSLAGNEPPHTDGLLEILGATAAGAGCFLARGRALWPSSIADVARLIASGHPPDTEEGDMSTIQCYLISLDADSPETDDWAIIQGLIRLVSFADDANIAAANGEATRKVQKRAKDILARVVDMQGTSEDTAWLKDKLSRWEIFPQVSRTKLSLALYYKSLHLLEKY